MNGSELRDFHRRRRRTVHRLRGERGSTVCRDLASLPNAAFNVACVMTDRTQGALGMSTENEVRKASEMFYAALNRMANGDATSLADIWSQGGDVTTMHPIGGREVGWERVRDSFRKVAEIASEGRVRLDDQIVGVTGDLAYELGSERGQLKLAGHPVTIDHRVTNVYRREAGQWKMVHHHTDVSPAMLDVLKRLTARA
jgi:ketosteroid isomerase-like protein